MTNETNISNNNKKKMSQMRRQNRNQNIFQAVLIVVLIIALNVFSSLVFFRADLTKEKRFSISDFSKEVLDSLDDEVYIEIYLKDKDLPSELVRYQHTVDDFMKNLCSYSGNIRYEFKNPFVEHSEDENAFVQKWLPFLSSDEEVEPVERKKIFAQLYNKGLNPTYVVQEEGMGGSEKIIFAGALVKYKEKDFPINLLVNSVSGNEPYTMLSATELEREFVHAMWMLSSRKIHKVAFLEGHDELDANKTYDIMTSLSKYYRIERVDMNGSLTALDEYGCVIIAKPQKRFTERDKYIIDQYIMNGGKVIWCVEWMNFDMDSLNNNPISMALMNDINLSDQLFNYGVRINPDLIQDLRCLQIPVCVNTVDGKPQFEPKPWFYFPLIVPDTLLEHQLVKNLDVMRTCFVSSIDTVGEDPNVNKTILLRTSPYSKALSHPVEISLDILREKPEMLTFNKPNIPIAVLLDGEFKSNFANRLSPELADNKDFKFKDKSKRTQMVVISDGDFVRNEIKRMGDKVQPYPLGYDKYYDAQYTPGNTQFIINCVNYLCADDGLISLRMREMKSRTLNMTKVKADKATWICFNTIVPVVIILLIGFTLIVMRKVKYSKKDK